MTRDVRYTMGLDLGKTRNYTAMVVMERVWAAATASEFIASGSRGYSGEYRHVVVKVDRVSLGTPYTRVVEWVKRVALEYGEEMGTIVVDASGLGSVVMDELRRAGMGVQLVGVVSTGEQASGQGRTAEGFHTIARAVLLTKLQIAVQSGKFGVDRARCREWEALRRELSLVKLEGGGRKSGKTQDDLAMALALAVWWGIRG